MKKMCFDKELLNELENIVKDSPWKDNTPMEDIVKISKQAFNNMKAGAVKQRKIYRLCGQSGSGKTSQLLAGIYPAMAKTFGKPVLIAVRNFAGYHPDYANIIKDVPAGEVRERTNGFALKCLFLTVCRLMRAGYLLLYDVTILDEKYEQLFYSQLLQNNYLQQFNILSVSLWQSTEFICKRFADKNNAEHGRQIAKSSRDYFYVNLQHGLNFYVKSGCKDPCVVWTAYNKKPVFVGNLKKGYSSFLKHKNKQKRLKHTEKILREYKSKFYEKYLIKKLW